MGFIPSFLIHTLVIAGLAAFFIADIIGFASRLVPVPTVLTPYYVIIKYAGLLVFIIGIFLEGVVVSSNELTVEIDKQKAVIAELQTKSKEVTVRTEIQYVDKVKTVTEKGKTITKYVDKVITIHDNAACILPQGYYDSVNAGARNDLSIDEINNAAKGTK